MIQTSTLKRLLLTFTFLATIQFCGATQADDSNWANWRGPNDNGTAADSAKPPIEWTTEKNVRWKRPIPGSGINTPIVWEDRIYLLTAIPAEEAANQDLAAQSDSAQQGDAQQSDQQRGEGRRRGEGRGAGGGQGRGAGRGPGGGAGKLRFVVMCLDRNTGNTLWEKTVSEQQPHEGTHNTNTYASGSAITNGNHLWAWFGSFGLYCLDRDGNVVWEKDFGNMQTRNSFGEGSTPALFEDTIVVPWDHEGPSKMYALRASTGEQLWSVDRDEPTTWSTPLITRFGDQVQVIANGTNRVRSYDLATGDVIWECGGQVSNPIPTPVRYGDSVICMTGHRGFSIVSIPLDSKGDVTNSDKVNWKRNDAAPYVPSPVLYQGRLYFMKANDAIFSVVSADNGDVLVGQTRIRGVNSTYASPIAANGHIYFAGRNGSVAVMTAGDNPQFVTVNDMEETIDASPVAVGNQLFIRTVKQLYCIEQSN